MRPLLALVLLLTLACGPRAEALDGPLMAAVTAPAADGSFDHSAFDRLLRTHVADGRVDYAGLRRDKPTLRAYADRLASADLRTLSPNGRKALLINAYNANTLLLLLEPDTLPASIKDLTDPWTARRWTVGGQIVSLDEIEHGLLRPVYKDPRIHFAVNCASKGCPPLRAGAYTGAALDAQLDEAARATLSNPAYARVEGGALRLTKILDWYGSDFTAEGHRGAADNVAAYIAPFTTEAVRSWIADQGGAPPVRFLPYDWSVNAK